MKHADDGLVIPHSDAATAAPRDALITRPLMLILVVGAVVRLALWLPFRNVELHHDECDYNALAVNLVLHGELSFTPGTPISIRPPFYPAVLAGIYRMLGMECFQAVRLLQAALSLLTVAVMYWLAADLFSRRVGLFAAGLFCFYPSLLGFNNLLMTETLFTFLLCVAIYAIVRAIQRSSLAMLAAGGVVLGLSALTRSVMWAFVVPLAVFLLLAWKGNVLRRLLAAGVVTLAFACTLAPWSIRNTRLEHTFIVVDTMGGRNLYMGNYAHTPLFRSWDAISLEGEQAWYHDLHRDFPQSDWDTQGKLDKLAARQGVRFITAHPGLTLQRDSVKFLQFWGLERELIAGAGRGYFGAIPAWGIVLLTLIIFGAYTFVMIAGVFGIAMAPPADRRLGWLLLLVIAFVWVMHAIVFAHSRYHLPVLVLLLPFSASAIAQWRDLWQRRRERCCRFACGVSALLVLGWLCEIVLVERERFLALLS